ncbi:MAG TPA: AAA-like domain-containing protein [Fimbriimonadaceae bacterium]|nr:AAA-like domain-containing protein [Fimbriimonadaceae bacterium]
MAVSEYFKAGGTLQLDSSSYVKRQADDELYECLVAGKLAYVLDSRQKGKSSLVTRTIDRLRRNGIATAHLDLQRLGSNLEPEQWYLGMLRVLGESVGMWPALRAYWDEHPDLSPFTRWSGAIESVILPMLEPGARASQAVAGKGIQIGIYADRLVVFVDEIDFVRALDFSTDEFFAGIRDLANRSAADPRFSRLTFCLIGVAQPSELIRRPDITPFNLGRRIELEDMTLAESGALAQGLLTQGVAKTGKEAQALLERIFYWTNGHPYLTQRVCSGLVDAGQRLKPEDVDRVVDTLFLQATNFESEDGFDNLSRRIFEVVPDGVDRDAYLFALSEVLERLVRRDAVKYDDADPVIRSLRLSGLVRRQGGQARIRNRIYERVFNQQWLDRAMPELEVRRRERRQRLRWLARMLATGGFCVIAVVAATWFWFRVQEESALARKNKQAADLYLAQANAKINEAQQLYVETKKLEFYNNWYKTNYGEYSGPPTPPGLGDRHGGTVEPAPTPPPDSLPDIVTEGERWRMTRERRITTADLARVPRDQWSLMRNEIYARRLYKFERRPDLRKAFRYLSGYQPIRTQTECSRLMTKLEKRNGDFIRDQENKPVWKALGLPGRGRLQIRNPNPRAIQGKIVFANGLERTFNAPGRSSTTPSNVPQGEFTVFVDGAEIGRGSVGVNGGRFELPRVVLEP